MPPSDTNRPGPCRLAGAFAGRHAGLPAGHGPDGGAEAEAVPLVVSELVTNAVQHAGGVTGFGL
jgi:hypothetical protein